MSPPPKLAFSHCIRGWHSLVYGQPSHMGQVLPVPPHARLPLWEVMKGGHHKRNMARWSPNDLPVKLPWVEKQEVAA